MTGVAVIGVGTIGGRVAAALRLAGREVRVHDLAGARVAAAVAGGATAAASPAAAASGARIVLLSLPGPEQVADAVAGEHGLLSARPRPALVADLSTVDPTTTRRLAAVAARAGVGYLDAPVLGRPQRCGRWTLPVGGDADTLDAARDTLTVIAERIVLVGGPGAGNAVKLLNNLMFGAVNAVTVEVMAAAERVGVDPRVFFDTVADSGAASVSGLFRELGPKILRGDTSPDFTVDLLAKDTRLGLEMAGRAGAPLLLARTVDTLNALGQAGGLGSLDSSALVEVYRRLWAAGGEAGR